jgi:hypothetical protein
MEKLAQFEIRAVAGGPHLEFARSPEGRIRELRPMIYMP